MELPNVLTGPSWNSLAPCLSLGICLSSYGNMQSRTPCICATELIINPWKEPHMSYGLMKDQTYLTYENSELRYGSFCKDRINPRSCSHVQNNTITLAV